ncbi:toxin glutamine deamidase domain-containing protein [Nocardia sp. NPDC058666]|uniref:scabin-related ADP-ribosyltransferase n=1 Tax=Nocardia sp. NPDC058666 TaxID=3346587 RepID=UPI00364EB590
MTAAELSLEIEFAQRAVDSAFNHAQELRSGDQFLVDLELTTDPDAADLRLNLQQHPFDLSNDLREHMGLPRSTPDTPLSPDDLRAISNDIARANTPSPLPDMPRTRVFAPGYLRGVEIPQYQHAVEDALRDGNRFMIGADPRTNPYGGLINDGGPHVPGRNINCLDASLSALSSFNGRPEVAAPRTIDLDADGTVSRRGEEHGPRRAEAWLGGQWQTFASPNQSVPQQFQALHDWISQMGPGSSALVINSWQAGGSHATTIVYPIGASGPVWWDPQQSTFSDTPPASLTSQSTSFTFMTVDQQGAANGTATTPNSGTTAAVPGTNIPDTGIQRAPEPTRMDLPRDSDPGGGREGDGSRPGELRSGQGDRGGYHPAEPGVGDDRGNVRHGDRNGESAASRTGLPTTESADTATAPARPGDDRVPGDSRVDNDNPAVNGEPASDHQQSDLGNHSVHTPGTDGGREGGVESAAQRHVADNGDVRGLAGTPDSNSPIAGTSLTPQEIANADQTRQARESLRPRTPENDRSTRVNPYGGRSYQVARYPNAFGQPIQVIRVTAHITGDPDLPQTALDAITDSAQQTIDHALNQGHRFPNGDWVMVDVVPVTNPAEADIHLDLSNTPTTDLANTIRQNLGLPTQNTPGLTPTDIQQLAADIDRATMTGGQQPSWADQHATTPETPAESATTEPTVDLDAIHNNHAEQTPAGISHHRGDPTMGDLPHRVPADPTRFTADTHITPDGHAIIGGQTLTPEQYGDLLRRSNWDGVTPIRLIGCDASTNGFADRLAQHLGVEVLAPTQAAWTDANGNVFSASAITNPDNTRRPRIPPDGQWQTHHPNGATTASDPQGGSPIQSESADFDSNGAISRGAVGSNQPSDPDDLSAAEPCAEVDSDPQPYGIDVHNRTTNERLYRSDNRPPDVIFEEGFQPRDASHTDLVDYVENDTSSVFVGTSRRDDIGEEFGGHYTYEIESPGGIDVNQTLGPHISSYEQEIAFPGGIPREDILGARPYNYSTGELGDFVRNPNYDPRSVSG